MADNLYRGRLLFGNTPGYVPDVGSAPHAAGWSFTCWILRDTAPHAMDDLSSIESGLLSIMHKAYCSLERSVSRDDLYRDILKAVEAGPFSAGQLSADSEPACTMPAEPEWAGIFELQTQPWSGVGRHFIHGLARLDADQGENKQGDVYWQNDALFASVLTNIQNVTVKHRIEATTHFPSGTYAWGSHSVGWLDERKVGVPFDGSPLRFKRRERAIP